MAELIPIPFEHLLKRMYYEYTRNDAIFDLPSRKFYRPSHELDLTVSFCGNIAANPAGPAAGPQTQLAQNIALSWLAGGRIIELKTVQVKDRLKLSRPCIHIATVGYNTEWSQELRLEESLREYVKASMIIEILQATGIVSRERKEESKELESVIPQSPISNPQSQIPNPKSPSILDISIGYDLEGIRSPQIRSWLHVIRNASPLIEEFRQQIPDELAPYRDLPFKTEIGNSITLSTFHGTPADEIERICEFLLEEMDYHVIIKMNPPMLGKQRLEYLLHDKLGYTDIEANPKAFDVNITFSEGVDIVRRLQGVAERTGKTIGVKFGNTLEVINKGTFLKEEVQYLSGQPLHVLHLALVAEWRKVFGAGFPISFSAGVDAHNFADCVAAGLVPVTTCTDLLREGGYGRLRLYLVNLGRRMKHLGVSTVEDFIVRSAFGDREVLDSRSEIIQKAILKNTEDLLHRSLENPRYYASNNRRLPRKIGRHLRFWDCINCDKCIPVCPNDANFVFEIEPFEIKVKNIEIVNGSWREVDGDIFKIEKSHQIANFADACNDCGNCDVFCPEDGGPYIEKPRFFGSLDSWKRWKTLSGFTLAKVDDQPVLYGRLTGKEFVLSLEPGGKTARFHVEGVTIVIDQMTHQVRTVEFNSKTDEQTIDMSYYFTMASLMMGLLNMNRIHFVNVSLIKDA